jgi:transposase
MSDKITLSSSLSRTLHPKHKARIKEIMTGMYVNKGYMHKDQIKAFRKEFAFFQRIYKGIDFNQIYITK